MKNRVLSTILISYIAGVVFSATIVGSNIFSVIAVLIIGVCVNAIFGKSRHLIYGSFIVLTFLIGVTWFYTFKTDKDFYTEKFDEKYVSIYGMVKSIPVQTNNSYKIIIKQKQLLHGEDIFGVKGNIVVYTQDKPYLKYGDYVNISGIMRRPSSTNTLDNTEYNMYYRTHDYYGIMSVDTENIISAEGKMTLNEKMYSSYYFMTEKISEIMPGSSGYLLRGIMLGDRSMFSEQLNKILSQSGISHIVSVSGLHVSMVISFVVLLISKFRGKRKVRSIIAIIGIVGYMIITGFIPSAIRAGIMGIMMMVAILMDKKEDFVTSILLAATIIICVNPYTIFDSGFLMSFSSTIGIIVLANPINYRLKKYLPDFLSLTVAASISAIIGIIPSGVMFFNTISIVGIFANIVVIPLTEVVFVGGFVALLLGNIFMPLGVGIGYIVSFLTEPILYVAMALSRIPYGNIRVSQWGIIHTAIFTLGVCILYLFLYNKKISKYLYVSFSAVICVAFLVHIITSTMFSVEFIDVGQGDSALITAPYRKYYLIDTGKGSSFACSTYLKNKGIVNLETVFITHVDDDHSGGLENILKEFHVKKVVMPKTDSVKEFIPLITCAGTDFEYADGFSGYKIGDGFADVVWPYPNKILTNVENNNSLCIRLQYKNYSFLFTGDLGVEAEKELLQTSEYLRSNILKVGHHGSKTSTSEEFLNEVLPKYGIVSVGKDNSYGHPETEIIDRLNEYGCKILRTDKLGNIIFTVVFGRLVLVN